MQGFISELTGLLAVIFVVGVPSMALASKYVLRPMIRDLTEAVRGRRDQERRDLEDRMARLEEVVQEQDRRIDRLLEAERFRRELESGGDAG
jgi:hypothetical protein